MTVFTQLKNSGGGSVSSGPTRPKPLQIPGQASWSQSKAKSDKLDGDSKYSVALKEATTLYSLRTNSLGCQKVAALMNKKHQLTDRKLNYRSILNYTKKDLVGKSPEKRGRPSRVPLPFWELLNCHISMTQLEGREETKPRHLKAIIGAALKNTAFEGFCSEVMYTWFRRRFTDTMCPVRTM